MFLRYLHSSNIYNACAKAVDKLVFHVEKLLIIMQKLFFWRNWPKNEQSSFVFILTILFTSILFLSFYWFKGLENIIHWDTLSELDEISVAFDTLSDGTLKFTINGNAYIVKERYLASMMEINFWANNVFAVFFILGLNLLLSAFSGMSRYWFLGGMVLFAGILITFHLEIVYNSINQLPFLVAFGAFAGLAFYKSEANDKAVPKWLLIVSVLTLVVIIARSMMPDEVEQDAQFEQQKIESQQEDLKDLEGLE